MPPDTQSPFKLSLHLLSGQVESAHAPRPPGYGLESPPLGLWAGVGLDTPTSPVIAAWGCGHPTQQHPGWERPAPARPAAPESTWVQGADSCCKLGKMGNPTGSSPVSCMFLPATASHGSTSTSASTGPSPNWCSRAGGHQLRMRSLTSPWTRLVCWQAGQGASDPKQMPLSYAGAGSKTWPLAQAAEHAAPPYVSGSNR